MRILVVEDDPRILAFVEKGLRESGYQVDTVVTGTDAYLAARYNPYDLLVLDLALPEMDGIEVARSLRREEIDTPILVLTARDTEEDIVRGLDAGADDYLTKPFGFSEFLARVRALLRRETAAARSSVLSVDDLELDTVARRVRRAGQEIALSLREYDLLEYLMHHAGQVVTRRRLMENVWSGASIESNVIDVYIGYLRQKIDAPFVTPLIRTIRGVGFSLRAP